MMINLSEGSGDDMWNEIDDYFKRFPAQKKVAVFLLKRGFNIGDNARVMCGNMEIPHTQIAKELNIDRRVVDAAAKRVVAHEKLKNIFQHLKTVAFLRDAAKGLGLGVIVITPDDASKPGIIGRAANEIARHDMSIRQVIADDPYLIEDPKLTIITDGEVSGKVLQSLKKIDGIKEITFH